MSGSIETFKVTAGDRDKNNKLMSCCIHDEKPLKNIYKTMWAKIEDLKNIELNALPIYDDRYRKTRIRTCGDKDYTNFHILSLLKDDTERESLTVISIDSLLVHKNKFYLQVYLDNCAYTIADNQMIGYLGENPFETDEDYFL